MMGEDTVDWKKSCMSLQDDMFATPRPLLNNELRRAKALAGSHLA